MNMEYYPQFPEIILRFLVRYIFITELDAKRPKPFWLACLRRNSKAVSTGRINRIWISFEAFIYCKKINFYF